MRPGFKRQSAAGVTPWWWWRGAEDRDHQSPGGQHIVLVGHTLACRLDGPQFL